MEQETVVDLEEYFKVARTLEDGDGKIMISWSCKKRLWAFVYVDRNKCIEIPQSPEGLDQYIDTLLKIKNLFNDPDYLNHIE